MKQLLTILLAMLTVSAGAGEKDVLDYVNTFIGTSSMGHVFPGACVPHGGVQLSPDTEAAPFYKDGKYYRIHRRDQLAQAAKANIDYRISDYYLPEKVAKALHFQPDTPEQTTFLGD